MGLTVSLWVQNRKNLWNYQKDTINFAAIDDYGILILVNMKMSYFCGEYCGQLYQETPILWSI
jgi:hypothetical protein